MKEDSVTKYGIGSNGKLYISLWYNLVVYSEIGNRLDIHVELQLQLFPTRHHDSQQINQIRKYRKQLLLKDTWISCIKYDTTYVKILKRCFEQICFGYICGASWLLLSSLTFHLRCFMC